MSNVEDDNDKLIQRFLLVDAPPKVNAPTMALVNITTPTTTQKSVHTAIRVRVGCSKDDAARRSFIELHSSKFDTYLVPMYKWFCVPDPDAEDCELQMAKALKERIRENLQKEVDFMRRKQQCMKDIEHQNELAKQGTPTQGEPMAAAREGLEDYVPPEPKPKPDIEIGPETTTMRFEDEEPRNREKFVVFSVMDLEGKIPGADVMIKLHAICDSSEEAEAQCNLSHQCATHKHVETCIGVLDAWLQLPPPEEVKVTYGDEQHDAIYKDRDKPQLVEAVKAYHENKNLEDELLSDARGELTHPRICEDVEDGVEV